MNHFTRVLTNWNTQRAVRVRMSHLPLGLRACCRGRQITRQSGRIYVFFCTLVIYASFHASRKPISVVKPVLHPNCTEIAEKENKTIVPENATFCMWTPFDTDNYNAIFGYLDLAYLLAYATGMFLSGHLAERMDLRVFLTIGCLLSGVTTALFGLGYFLDLHQLPFYLIAQTLAGFVQSSGWPAVVTCMGNWFGKGRRGLVLGLWNSHTSLGNILGGLLAGIFVESAWGWSFVVPGALIGLMGILVFFFLIPSPEDAGLQTSMSSEVKNYQTLVSSQQQSEENKTENEISGVKEAEDYEETSSETQTLIPSTSTTSRDHVVAISFCGALAVPGVVEYSLCLFFVKSVSYTFLFWLPAYIQSAGHFKAALSADLSTVFDIGGIIGGVLAGVITDLTSASAAVCSVMLTLAIPMVNTSRCVLTLHPETVFIFPLNREPAFLMQCATSAHHQAGSSSGIWGQDTVLGTSVLQVILSYIAGDIGVRGVKVRLRGVRVSRVSVRVMVSVRVLVIEWIPTGYPTGGLHVVRGRCSADLCCQTAWPASPTQMNYNSTVGFPKPHGTYACSIVLNHLLF
uniref:Sugar phosphate exchanger 2 n=1 Tax=Schistocephalus solidus TaxID=70667 RepID=A0A0V0J8V3_SCHSO